ncbi:hypothetical protein [Acidovorax sp. SUPP2539]|uniref:hypothetical protein n=1 Tax=Acidovorax sp. SUPP2539 TaxID=2920878 RepID=UPI0023DE3C82|nr:hypothetical protein [Acidovorax sp. SUPP2539]GKS91906.1 hypothetical protein AVTE2539_21095 [Acidovorax sp. SUPP2539]
MNSKTQEKPKDLIDALIWLVGSESKEIRKKHLQGQHLVNFDGDHPDRAWKTSPDGSVVHGRLLEDGTFIPDETGAVPHQQANNAQ